MALGAQTSTGDTLLKLNPDPSFPWDARRSSPLFLNNPSNLPQRWSMTAGTTST
ncbi:MAG: hypothetical protein U5L72_06115 [Bacteroidales bacterium]|nr:hypothetical protein [Bacteroidales bacterium]